MFWNGVLYIGIVTAPAAMLLFALDYGGRWLPLTLMLSLLVEHMGYGVLVLDEGHRIVDANLAGTDLSRKVGGCGRLGGC